MKNIMKSLILLSIILMAFSCSKGTEECSECGLMPVDKVLNIKIGNIDKTFNLWKNDGRNNTNDYCIILSQKPFSNIELSRTFDLINTSDLAKINTSSLIGVTYFVNKNISKQPGYVLNNDDLQGLFVYYEDGPKMKVKVFEKENTLFKEITSLNLEMDWISYNDMETFSQVFFNKGLSAVSVIHISDHSKIFERKGSKDQFSYKLNKYVNKGVGLKPTGGLTHTEHQGPGRCGSPCLAC